MKLKRWRMFAILSTIGLAAVAMSIKTRVRTTAVKSEPPTTVAVPELGPRERPAFERTYHGAVCRSEPVGWVFGRMIGVNASAMKTFKPGPFPPVDTNVR